MLGLWFYMLFYSPFPSKSEIFEEIVDISLFVWKLLNATDGRLEIFNSRKTFVGPAHGFLTSSRELFWENFCLHLEYFIFSSSTRTEAVA